MYIRYSTDNQNWTSFVGGQEQEIQLGNGDNLYIDGLAAPDLVSVSEDNEDYVASVNDSETNSFQEDGSEGYTELVNFVNTKEATVPTGIIENVLPFALIMVLALAIGFIYFKRSRQEA